MSIATVVTRGYGSFGSVNLVPTRGYSIAAIAQTSTGFYRPFSTETASSFSRSSRTADTLSGAAPDTSDTILRRNDEQTQ